MNTVLYIILILNFCICNESINFNTTLDNKIYNKTFEYKFFNYTKFEKKNVILGIIQHYSLYKIMPFFKSLIFANFKNCDVVMFVRNVSKDIINYLKSIDVFIFEIPNIYKNISVINLRWKLYIDFLNVNKNKYKLVLHSDIRDTIFQKDIFQDYENHKPFIGVAIEDGFLNKGRNKKWIIDYVGFDKYKKIQKERIICVGTIWGTIDIFLNFSIYFWERLIANPNSIEQGIANYMLYYEKLFDKYIIKSDNYGLVMTLALANSKNISLDNENNILNYKGKKAAIIHQYDRKPILVKKIINKYCPELIIFWKEMNFIRQNHRKIEFDQKKNMKIKYVNIIYFFVFLILFILLIFYKYFIY